MGGVPPAVIQSKTRRYLGVGIAIKHTDVTLSLVLIAKLDQQLEGDTFMAMAASVQMLIYVTPVAFDGSAIEGRFDIFTLWPVRLKFLVFLRQLVCN